MTGIDGTFYNSNDVSYDAETHQFFDGEGNNITNNLKLADMLTIPGFNQDDFLTWRSENARGEKYTPALPTNTSAIFLDQVVSDPLDAPIAALPDIGKGITTVASHVENDILLLAGLAIVGFFAYQFLVKKYVK